MFYEIIRYLNLNMELVQFLYVPRDFLQLLQLIIRSRAAIDRKSNLNVSVHLKMKNTSK